jgi:4-diphosphocytidyl-2-C-methyl-D-erythritol kinase
MSRNDEDGSKRFVRAFAKVNLTLDVLGRRADGYHELASVMQTVALADTLSFQPLADGRLEFFCDVPELNGPENLVCRAAHLLREATGCRRGARIELAKGTPAQAGLGGGSSDAAFTLLALHRWWRLGLSQEQLLGLAARLGSDVPFFMLGGTALVEGRGERVTPLPDLSGQWLILLKPPVAVSTPLAFRALTADDFTTGAATAKLVAAIRAERQTAQASLLQADALVNALEERVCQVYPEVAEGRSALKVAGAPLVRMSGSGPTLFAPFAALDEAAPVYRRLVEGGHEVWLTRTVSRAEALADIERMGYR